MNTVHAKRVPVAEDEGPLTLVYEIFCKACGSSSLAAAELSLNGATRGLAVRCQKCDAKAVMFDAAVHGYDGELGYNNHLDGEAISEPLQIEGGAAPASFYCIATYNMEAAELAQMAEEARVRAVDLFDWFSLSRIAEHPDVTGWAYETIWEFECA